MNDLYRDLADLYAAAFDWDRSAELDFLRTFFRPDDRLLEPMCGPGYLLEAFARSGAVTVGVDNSPAMLAIAHARFARAGLEGRWLEADVTDFALDEACTGSVCPLNSVALLPGVVAMGRHLRAMGQAMHHGSAYLVQLDMATPEGVLRRLGAATDLGRWNFTYEGETVSCEWYSTAVDERVDRQVSRFRFPDGRTLVHEHQMTLWRWESWSALVEVSPFRQEAAFSGDDGRYAGLALDTRLDDRPLTWHYLTRR